MQRSQLNMAVQSDPNVLHKFKAGFTDCTDEVNRYISQMDGVDSGVKQRLIGHLASCVSGIQQVASPFPTAPFSSPSNGYRTNTVPQPTGANSLPFTTSPLSVHQQSNVLPLSQDVNNNGNRIQMGGLQLIPSRLSTGELALVMPNSSNLPYFPTTAFGATNGNSPSSRGSLDLSTSLPRVGSAFNSVGKTNGKHLSTDTSPPLSPASSMSSGDDSLSHNDYQASLTTTPPLQSAANFINAFPTPPSGGSISLISTNGRMSSTITTNSQSPTATLQQPQVTSTTEPPTCNGTSTNNVRVKPLSVITNINNNNTQGHQRIDVQYVNKKRPYPIDLTDDNNKNKDAIVEPCEKQMKTEDSPANQDNDGNGDMWRPW